MKDFTKVKCRLTGTDGNIFFLLARSCRALRNAGFPDKADELNKRITVDNEAKDYTAALAIILEYVIDAEE